MGDFNMQSISNTVHALAMVDQSDAQLFTGLARLAEQHVDAFKLQSLKFLNSVAKTFAMVGQPDAKLFTALAREAVKRIGDFNVLSLNITA